MNTTPSDAFEVIPVMRAGYREVRRLALLLVIASFCSCAKVGAPPGGSADESGPSVSSSFPEPDATSVTRKITAWLEFSEPVNRASVEAALFFAPDPGQRLRYKWRGRRLFLDFLDSLESNRTYVISLGSEAKDIRGNPIGYSYTIAFSTGAEIDRGRLEGRIAGEKSPQSISIWAYSLQDSLPDPERDEPEYRLQASRDGTFRFGYLRNGRYRMFAVHDRNLDGKWNRETEPLGIAPWDVVVVDTTPAVVTFRLSVHDTSAVRVLSSRVVHRQAVSVRLSREIDSLKVHMNSEDGDSLRTVDAFADSIGSLTWTVYLERSLRDAEYVLSVTGVDANRVPWSGVDTLSCRAREDTARPKVIGTIPTSRTPSTTPVREFSLWFDEPVQVRVDSMRQILVRATDGDSVFVNGEQRAPREFVFYPTPEFREGKKYTVSFDGRHVVDPAGNSLADTTTSYAFASLAAESLGVAICNLEAPPGNYLVSLLDLQGKPAVADTFVTPGSIQRFERLMPGRYLIQAVWDRDNDSAFSFGSVSPFSFSDPFIVLDDTLSIRARWESEITILWNLHP